MLKITGVMLLALGLVAGLVLVASPFGMLPFARSSFPGVGVLFPTSFAAGSVLLALASPRTALGWLRRFCSVALLGLASASALGLMLALLGIQQPAHATLSLWYVLMLSRRGRDRVCAGAGRRSLRIEHTAPPRECTRAPLSTCGCSPLHRIRRVASSAKCSGARRARAARPTAVPREAP